MKKILRTIALLALVVLTGGLLATDVGARGGRGGRGGGRGGGRPGRGGRGGGTGGNTNREDVAKDLEERQLQAEKEDRIGEARQAGAESVFDELHRKLLDEEREKAAAERRADWRGRANPG